MSVKFWQTRVRFWFFHSYLITTVHEFDTRWHELTQNDTKQNLTLGLNLFLLLFSGAISVDGIPKRPETVQTETNNKQIKDKKPEIDESSHPNSVYQNSPYPRPLATANSPATLSVSFSCLILAFLLHNWFDLT